MERGLRGGDVVDRTRSERLARFRRRQRDGLAVLHIEIDEYQLIDIMLREHVLTEAEALDRGKVEEAAARILATWVAARR